MVNGSAIRVTKFFGHFGTSTCALMLLPQTVAPIVYSIMSTYFGYRSPAFAYIVKYTKPCI